MRKRLGLYLAGCCLVSPGCGPIFNEVRTLVCEPAEYSRRIDNATDCKRNKIAAEAAWADYQACHLENEYSYDFTLGFLEGFADYLYAGGTGMPPPIPYRTYWRPEFESVEGHAAIKDWFTGFKEGAAVARQSKLRNLVVVPASTALPPVIPPPPPPSPPSSMLLPGTVLQPPAPPLPQPEQLPKPKINP